MSEPNTPHDLCREALEAAVREALGHLSAAVERIGSYPVGHHDVPSGRQNLHDGVQILKLALEPKQQASEPCREAINKCHEMFEHTADWCAECEAEMQPCEQYVKLHGDARQAVTKAHAALSTRETVLVEGTMTVNDIEVKLLELGLNGYDQVCVRVTAAKEEPHD